MMNRRRTRTVAAAVLIGASTVFVYAAVPSFWQVSTEGEFLRGDVENLTVDSYGRLTLGPTSRTLYDTTAPFIWTAIAAPDGTIYAGSGNDGQVYRIDASGRGTVFFDADELTVHALALASDGGLYVGTSPDGRIYRIDSNGRSRVFFDPPERYIWSLVVDRTGHVYAGTGDQGVIYKIAPDGTGGPFYETRSTHAMSLAFDRDGRLLAGTASPARVFRIDASGKPFVLLDSSYAEIHALRVDARGVVYAAAISGRSGGQAREPPSLPDAPPAAPMPSVSAEITGITIVDAPAVASATQTATAPRAAPGALTGAIFRILPDDGWDVLWELRDDTPYDVAPTADGVLVATGGSGKIYRLSGDPHQPTLVARVNVQQVTTLLTDRQGEVVFATSNPGRIFRLSSTRAERGTYTSEVRDAQTVATWGAIRWEGRTPTGTRIEISTRAGNTRTPDETWSEWSPAYTRNEGSPISSPRARYLQWRAVLIGSSSQSPMLTSVTAAYLPRNIRPRVTSITVHPPGTVFQRQLPVEPEIAGFDGELPDRRFAPQNQSAAAPALGRRTYQRGLLTIVWRAEDDNRDELVYDVLYRREGEDAWKPLREALTEPILVWDTTSVPNGRYVVRVVASDAPSNSPATALTGALESSTFVIDNAPPSITVTSARREGTRTVTTFEVRDEHSPVLKVEYSLDGDRWQMIFPKDGIADSRFEEYELILEGNAGVRGVIIRATDALNNVATADVPAPRR